MVTVATPVAVPLGTAKFNCVPDAYAICATRLVPAESFTLTIAPPSVVGQFADIADSVDVAMVGPKIGEDATIEPGATGPPSKEASETLITPGVTLPPP